METSVCAVVVTYNRRDLLRECLQALLTQTQSVALIWVINNVSTDDTLAMLAECFPPEQFPQLRVTTLPKNVGGAGGFHEGVKQAAAAGFEWFWLMDDDTIPQPDALAQLLVARARFPEGKQPDLLASNVIWTDGSLHPMNLQWLKADPREEAFRAAEAGTLALRSTTFVSLLLHQDLVLKYGLPIASYFIGGDDMEYTARILKREFGVAVPQSVVLHKTPTKAGSVDAPPLKFYYYVRNSVWMMTRSTALSHAEAAKLALRFFGGIWRYLVRTRFHGASLSAVGRGLWDGFSKIP